MDCDTSGGKIAFRLSRQRSRIRDDVPHRDARYRAIGLPSDRNDIAAGLAIACEIKGLGPAGGSGLLAVLFPDAFGTADQFVVKALRGVPDLPESSALARMRPAQLTLTDAAILIAIMRRQAAKNLGAFR